MLLKHIIKCILINLKTYLTGDKSNLTSDRYNSITDIKISIDAKYYRTWKEKLDLRLCRSLFFAIDQLQVLYKILSDLPLYAIAHFRVLREQILRMFRE